MLGADVLPTCPSTCPTKRRATLSRTVIVKGFDANLVSEHELVEHFEKVGTVERFSVRSRKAKADHRHAPRRTRPRS